MLSKLILLALAFLSASFVFGQSNISFIEQDGDLNSVNVSQDGYQNIFIIHQKGNTNFNSTVQDGSDNYFFYNDIESVNNSNPINNQLKLLTMGGSNDLNYNHIYQSGDCNNVIITNSGPRNVIDVSQSGRYNFIDTRNIGEENIYNISQQGDMNQISQQVTASKAEYNLAQIGDHNRIVHRDNTITGISLDITQTGNWIVTTIIDGNLK